MTTSKGLLRPAKTYQFAGIVPFINRNPGGNWSKWLPFGEEQYSKSPFSDSMACVSYSLKHCIETQEYFLTGKQIRYSARWLAKISGTTPAGNYLATVAQTVQDY